MNFYFLGGGIGFQSNGDGGIYHIKNCVFLNNRGSDGSLSKDVFIYNYNEQTKCTYFFEDSCTDVVEHSVFIDGNFLDLLSLCDSDTLPSPTVDGGCPSPFFVTMDGESCVLSCPDGSIGSFGKCFNSCNYSWSDRDDGGCETSSCLVVPLECECRYDEWKESCEMRGRSVGEGLCVWIDENNDMNESGYCLDEVCMK
jgi:hypothetical protein